MSWLWFIPILLIMVVIHEMGHFLTARLFGMKVHEFGIGFPPKVWSKKTKDGMEWSINALPIGGFVRIEGENGDSDDPNAFGKKKPWQRAIVLIAGPFMNLLLAFVLYLILAGAGREVVSVPTALLEVVPNSPAAIAGLQSGDQLVQVNGKPVKDSRDITIETTLDKTKPLELTVFRPTENRTFQVAVQPRKEPPQGEGPLGVRIDYTITKPQLGLDVSDFGLKKGDYLISANGQPINTNFDFYNATRYTSADKLNLVVQRKAADGTLTTITKEIPFLVYADTIWKDSDAARQGLKGGETITAINGQPVYNTQEYEKLMAVNAGKNVQLSYKPSITSNEVKTITVTANKEDVSSAFRPPRVMTVAQGIPMISWILPTRPTNFNPIEVVGDAFDRTGYAITLIPRTLNGFINGSIGLNNLAGPIGMAQVTNTVFDAQGFIGLMGLMALLSVNLGIINILPFPALDGGRLVFVLIEMITFGRRVPPEKEALVHAAGMAIVLLGMVAIAWQDIARLISNTPLGG